MGGLPTPAHHCLLPLHCGGRASLLRQPPSHCGARAPRMDRAQDGIVEKETAAGQGNMDSRKIANNSYERQGLGEGPYIPPLPPRED